MGSGSLKPGWARIPFGDVVRLCTDRSADPVADGFERYVGLEHLDPGDLTIRRWGNIADGTTFTNVFRPGHVLFGKRRAYQRKVAVPDFSGVCSGDIYVLESKNNRYLLPELLPFICQTDAFFQHAIGTSAGSLSPRTNWQSLATYEFALPPVDERVRLFFVGGRISLCGSEAGGNWIRHGVVREQRRGPVADGTCAVSDGWGCSAGTRALGGGSQYASMRRRPVAA